MLGLWVTLAAMSGPAADTNRSPEAIREELRHFGTYATVLHVAAHPDDENTQLIAYLARGRGYRVGYLSMTRGDGGQNEIGPEFGERLGVARTQELLAARRIDGAHQFFTRALDFGYSKSVPETLNFWDRNQVIADTVRVIRLFRPDVIITRFSPDPSGTHAHHTASAVIALEAFKLAGDTNAFPEQFADGLTPWQPLRIVHNGGRTDDQKGIVMQAGGNDAVTGESFQAIAMRSRAQHRTQGFGMRPVGGGTWQESFRLLGGAPATNDIFDGIDTTWSRVPGGSEITRLTEEARAQFDLKNPARSVPALFELRKRIAELPNDPVMSEKRHQLDHILLGCLGLRVESTSPVVEVVPGESLKVQHQVSSHSEVPIRWIGVRVAGSEVAQPGVDLKLGKVASADSTFMVPTSTPLTQPYWLMEAPTKGMFRVSEARRIGTPENPPAFPVEFEFEVGGQKLTVPDEVVGASSDGQLKRELLVISPVALKFSSGVAIFSPGIEKAMEVEIQSARSDVSGSVHLEVPTGWSVSPAELPFSIQRSGETTKVGFLVRAPASHSSGTVAAVANINGARFSNQRVEIRYSHIPFQLLQPPALVKVAAFDVATRGRHVGYLPGAGDDTAAALMQLGYQVTALTGEDLTAEKLGRLDAVVIGVRAFNERGDLAANLPALFSYVEAGGNVVVQYNRPDRLKAGHR